MSTSSDYHHQEPIGVMGDQPLATGAHASAVDAKHHPGVRNDVIVTGTMPEKGGDVMQHNHLTAGAAVLEQSTLIPMTGERKVTKKSEVFSYCLMYIALTGLGPFNYMPAQLQNLLTQQFPDGFVQWGGQNTSISSLILDLNGIQFAVQTVLLLMIGPYADYGTWRPWLLIAFTIISWGVGFGWAEDLLQEEATVIGVPARMPDRLGLENPVSWNAACGLYVVATVAFNLANTFYFAAFPALVRNRPHIIAAEQEVLSGQRSPEDYAELDMRERSKISNYSLATSAAGSCCILVLGLVVPFTVGVDTTEQNTRVYSILIAYFTAVWIIFAMPWFLTEQYRPGQRLPKGSSYLTIGPKQLWRAMREISKLRYTFLYLLAFFMLNDVYTVLGLSVNLLQNDAIDFDTKQFTYLFILAFGSQAIGAYGIAMAQRWLKFSAKTGCMFGAFWMVAQCLWGLVGLWTDKIGYHHVWEFYLFQAWTGVLTAGWNTYSNTVISEVVPAPRMYLFFSLFFIVGKTSSFVGPFIASAIINDADGNTSASFWWTFFSGVAGLVLLSLVDVKKAKIACAEYLEKEAHKDYADMDAAQGQDGATQFEKAMANRAVMQPVH